MPTIASLQTRLNSEKKQKGYAWYRFYEEVKKEHENKIVIKEQLENAVPNFLTNEIKELYDKLKLEISCPICYEELTTEQIQFSNCGHKYCKECLDKLDKCAFCKKKIYHKNS